MAQRAYNRFTGSHFWPRLRACLQRTEVRAPVFGMDLDINSDVDSKCSNLILACKGVPWDSQKGAGGLDHYPSLRAEFGANKIHGSSLNTFHTESWSLRAMKQSVSTNRMAGAGIGAGAGVKNQDCSEYQISRVLSNGEAPSKKGWDSGSAEGRSESYAGRGFRSDATCIESGPSPSWYLYHNDVQRSRKIQLFIKTWDKTLSIQAAEHDDVLRVKEKIYMKTGISIRNQILTMTGFPLNNKTSLKHYNIKDNSTLDLHERMLGGSNRQTHQSLSDQHFNDLRKLLSPVIGFFKGDDIPPNTILEETTDHSEATGDLLNSILTKLLGNEAHIIHPNSVSLCSIFDMDNKRSEEAINTLASLIFDIKCVHLKDKQEAFMNNPILDKPIIAILNTRGKDSKFEASHPLEEYFGSHWVSIIITPKDYKGLSFNNGKEQFMESSNEKVFLFDSLPISPEREIPTLLRRALTSGKTLYEECEDQVIERTILPAINKNAEFWVYTKNTQQSLSDNTCGFWAIYNALMIVLQGNDNNYWKLFHRDSSEEETRFNAGCYIRWLFTKCISFAPSDILKLLGSHMNASQKIDENVETDINNISQETKDIARILAYSESPIEDNGEVNIDDKTKKPPSPYKRTYQKNSKKSQKNSLKKEKGISSSKRKRNKRKFDDYYQKNLDEMVQNKSNNPIEHPLTDVTKKLIGEKEASQALKPQEKILLNISEVGKAFGLLKKSNFELAQKLLKLEKDTAEKDHEIQKLLLENQKLQEQNQELANSKDDGYAWTLLNLTKQSKQMLELDLNYKNQKILELEGLESVIKTQESIVQDKDLQIQKITRDNDQLRKQLDNQMRESEYTLANLMQSLNSIQTFEVPHINENITWETNTMNRESFGSQVQNNRISGDAFKLGDKTPYFVQSGKMEIENSTNQNNFAYKKKVFTQRKDSSADRNKYKDGNQNQNIRQRYQRNSPPGTDSPIFIPWKGKVLTPTHGQILTYEGNLNRIYEEIGHRDPTEKEKHYQEIRISWKGTTLKPTPGQLLVSKGNLNNLMKYLSRREDNSFRQQSWDNGGSRRASSHSKASK